MNMSLHYFLIHYVYAKTDFSQPLEVHSIYDLTADIHEIRATKH